LAEAGVPEAKAAEVARLVRLTVTHDPADDDRDGQVLCDADLAILASPPSAYAAYTAAVREEYHFVPNDAFREGRAAVLRQLLGLPSLFRTSYGREHWEATARYNLRGELEMLSTPVPPPS
ncbi:HD domain-containing protein, partial [Streptomyces hirsutus]